MLTISHEAVAYNAEVLPWAQLVGVWIVTTSDGPFFDDVAWVLLGQQGSKLVIPSEKSEGLLKHLQKRLPNFRNDIVIEAMCTATDHVFVVWQGCPGEALEG